MKKRQILTILLFFAIFSSSVSAVQSEVDCNAIQETKICIKQVSVSNTTPEVGTQVEISLIVHNSGNQMGDAVVLLGIRQPAGEYTYHRVEEIHNLRPNDTQDATIILKMERPPGVHELNVMVFDEAEEHLYESTGYYQKISVTSKSNNFDLINWFLNLGKLAQAAIAIATLISILAAFFLRG